MPRVRPADALIALWLLVQVGLPAAWYLGGQSPDQRFAWRMFSSDRLTHCKVSGALTEVHDGVRSTRDADLSHHYQDGWISLLTHRNPDVEQAVLADLCEEPDSVRATLRLSCKRPDGTAPEPERMSMDCGPK